MLKCGTRTQTKTSEKLNATVYVTCETLFILLFFVQYFDLYSMVMYKMKA